MILEFTIENFRSIKNRQTFSMIAESSKMKGGNVFDVSLPNGDSVRLLKTAMIYGANASGKSNFIKAFQIFIQLITRRISGAGRPVRGYEPFLFEKETVDQPTIFELIFVFESVKYKYRVAFNISNIVEEELVYFPKGQKSTVFKRSGSSTELLHKIKMGGDFNSKQFEVFNNQLGLNKFGTDTPHDSLSKLYVYFDSIEINNAISRTSNYGHVRRIATHLIRADKQILLRRLENMIKVADTKISGLDITPLEVPLGRFSPNDNEGQRLTKETIKTTQTFGIHKMYENGVESGFEKLEFNEESEGTNALFWRGGLILEKLDEGGILVFDELDNSLHPKLVKFLVSLFSNPRSNPNNAQLIFATHEVTLLDRDLFRTDQIWFAEKNIRGETELFSAQDFDGVREDVPFDKWYMAGKFGGLPKIEDIESIFNNE
jgi:AAA15 family ATPase/GTPase